MEKIITSHRYRVKRANETIKEWPIKVSIFDREAFVEFYLLWDIIELYEHLIKVQKARQPATARGEESKARTLELLNAILAVFKTAADICEDQLYLGHFKNVWGSINEHALKRAARKTGNPSVMAKLAIKLLKDIYAEAADATKTVCDMDDEAERNKKHDANVRTVRGIPSREEIDAIIADIEDSIDSNTNTNRGSSTKPILN